MQLSVNESNELNQNTYFEDALKGLSIEAQAIARATATLILDEMAYGDFSWTVWHEGIRLFDFRNPGSYRDVNAIRKEALGVQGHNSGAQQRISALSNNELAQLLPRVTDEIRSSRDVGGHFRWVALHENRLADFRDCLAAGDFEEIRRIYNDCQGHNPNARSLLAGISNGHLTTFINAL